MKTIVNVRNATGLLIGTAALDVAASRLDVDFPRLLTWQGRSFIFSRGTFAYESEDAAEYTEVQAVPVAVSLAVPADAEAGKETKT